MKLSLLINEVKDQTVLSKDADLFAHREGSIDIKGLSLNSKLVKKGDVFFCLPGTRCSGTNFLEEACSNGARVAIVNKEAKLNYHKELLLIKVKDTVKSLGVVADKFYGYPLKKLNTIAVTGTNGKTSTTFIIENILKSYRKKVGVIGTINYRISNNKIIANNTTPDILTTYKVINRMINTRVKYLLMEVSSHALEQRRIEGLRFNQAIFTNLSQDHLDYHVTKKNYFKAKSRLFMGYLQIGGTAIINADDTFGIKLINLVMKCKKHKVLTYGISKKADICAKEIMFNNQGCSFVVQSKKFKTKIHTNLIGLFNIYNCLAAIASSLTLGIPKKYIESGLRNIYVPGRLELVSHRHNVSIFVDYAHTEDALRNSIQALKNIKKSGRLIVVFGCGGNRDRGKRQKMGRVASKLADFVIITSDNPRFEEPQKIISEIKMGVVNKNNLSIVDRKKAIKKAIDIAKSQDIILIAGKGHEDYQIIKNKRIAFNDRAVVRDILS